MSSPRSYWDCPVTRDQLSLNEIADSAAELSELRTTADDILSHAWTVERTRSLLDGPEPAFDEDLWKTTVEEGQILRPREAPAGPEREVTDLTDYRSRRVSAGQPGSEESAPGRIRTYAPASGGRCSIP